MSKRAFSIVLMFLLAVACVSLAQAELSPLNQYDANGSLVSGDGKYYEYNDANRLVRVRENDQAGKVITEYFYDHAGQRIKKVENGVTTYYVGKHFETQVVEGKTSDTSYYFALGERVAKKDSTGTYFYHTDHLGGTSAVTNAAGTVVAKNSYLPFGEIREGGQEKYSYTGKEKDKITDLYYFEARYNHPEFRHFTQADEVEPDYDDPQDLNRYSYVGNNPLSFVDPDGHKKKKKAKLSKREKWMIAHGSDPDKDKTSLKKAKKLFKEGKQYGTVANASPAWSSQGLAQFTPKADSSTFSNDRGFGSGPFRSSGNKGGYISQGSSSGVVGQHGWSRVLYGGLGLVGGSEAAIVSGASAVGSFDASAAVRSLLSLGAAIYSLGEIMAGEKEIVEQAITGRKVEYSNDLDALGIFGEIDDARAFGGI